MSVKMSYTYGNREFTYFDYGTPLKLANPEFDRIASLMPDCCPVEIIPIVSTNTENYDKRLAELIEKSKQSDKNKAPIIKEMFHGTKAQYVESIIVQGLKASYNRTSAYGKGTYFSPHVKFSLNGYTNKGLDEMSYVFVCDVIVNDTKGNKSTIYVCPNDNSFLIKYLVKFYKLK